jgi:GntR family transcriptional regulator, transcriptional repressor for pyruvate dehydrogenase complex
MTFTQIERSPLYRQVAEQIREVILSGGLAPGHNLPTERELSETFGVSRASIREALRHLEAQGLVSANGNSGARTVVSEASTTHLMDAMVQLLRLQHVTIEDLVDLRTVIETAAARRAAEGRENGALQEAHLALAVMRDEGVDVEEFYAADVRFHVALVRASGSEAMYLVMLAVREAIARHLLIALRSLPEASVVLAELAREHDAILAAVEAGDGAAAAEMLRDHILNFYRRFVFDAP